MKYPILELMKESNAPLTREEYLRWNYLGKIPDDEEIDESTLPPQFRRGGHSVFIKPPNARMMVVAENVTVMWVKEWLRDHERELRPKGFVIWIVEDSGKKPLFVCENCGVDCSEDAYLLPSGRMLCPSCVK